ncbi:MAG: hypothetical protein R6X02_21720 [Enhygromyxa sp.]
MSEASIARRLARLARLRFGGFGVAALGLGLGLGLLLATARCDRELLRGVTYNIEDFPKHDTQVELAFRTLAGLDAPVVVGRPTTRRRCVGPSRACSNR